MSASATIQGFLKTTISNASQKKFTFLNHKVSLGKQASTLSLSYGMAHKVKFVLRLFETLCVCMNCDLQCNLQNIILAQPHKPM